MRLFALTLLILGLATPAPPKVLHSWIGEDTERYGFSVSGAGDANMDGFSDIVVGAPDAAPNGEGSGAAWIYDGKREKVLHALTGENEGEQFGFSVRAAGDVNNDGFADVIVGAPGFDEDRGAVYVFDGHKARLLHSWEGEEQGDRFGQAVDSAGDVNADGFADLIVGAPGTDHKKLGDNAGFAFVYSGKKGKVLHEIKPETAGEQLGWAVSGVGDVNTDGFSDFAVGAPSGAKKNKKPATGVVRVYHGKKGRELHTFLGEKEDDGFGHSVRGAGDVNMDGFADLVIGTSTETDYVKIMDGKKGKELYRFETESPGNRFGWSVAGAGDVNADTYDDVIVGVPGAEGNADASGHAVVYSGKTGEVLLTPQGEQGDGHFGICVSGAGDLDSDSFSEVVVGADGRGSSAGVIRVYTIKD